MNDLSCNFFPYLKCVTIINLIKFTDGVIPSVFHTIIDGINLSVYFKRETFFLRAIFVCKTINKCFFLLTDLAMEVGITDKRKADKHFLSGSSSVKKLPMNSESHTNKIFPLIKL